ncbi:ribitol-5-phosphate transferase FKTN-like [Babylonia areolata]|uniref:ribitol-5-phosphate transferase FKTN-like n=1 Tax=Babylonia areolata TaxID=304850 RepID=UPI003FD1B195
MHFLWWTPVHDFGELRIHLVVFRSRAGYLWYDNMFPSLEPNAADRMKLPFWMPRDSIGQKAALIDRFATREDTIGGMNVSVPANMTDFRFRLQHGLVAECNHVTAKRLVTRYRASQVFNPTVRKRVLQILNITARTLDRLGLPFWLSAGTLLGWYRQCDVVPYTNDVDIEMRIQDYTPKMTGALVASGLKRLKQIGKVEDGFQLRFGFGGIFIDIFFCYEEQDHVWWNMFSDSQKYRYVFPKYSLRWTEFGGLRVRVPYPVEMYLTALYGQEWSKPVRMWNWLMGPRNKVPAGFWSKEDLPTVDIEF